MLVPRLPGAPRACPWPVTTPVSISTGTTLYPHWRPATWPCDHTDDLTTIGGRRTGSSMSSAQIFQRLNGLLQVIGIVVTEKN